MLTLALRLIGKVTAWLGQLGTGWQLPSPSVLLLAIAAGIGFLAAAWPQLGAPRQSPERAYEYRASIEAGDSSSVDHVRASVRWGLVEAGSAAPKIRAEIEVPERGLLMTLSIAKNDTAGGYVIEVGVPPSDYPSRQLKDVSAPLLKSSWTEPGIPLVATVTEARKGVFVIALSGDEPEMMYNVDLLREKSYFELPVAYESDEHASIVFRKGKTGQRIFKRAFTSWHQQASK